MSPPLTPFAGKEQASASKSQSGRKPALGSTIGETPPQSSIRGSSVSPKLTPRSAIGSTIKPRKSVSSSLTENPLAKSVSSFASLRKENTKPSAGRPSGNSDLQLKDRGSGRFSAVSEAHPLEPNVNVLVSTPYPVNEPIKEDEERGSSLPRKSYADVKILSTLSNDNVMAPLCKAQREVKFEATALSKSKRNDAGFFEEDMHSAEKESNYEPVRLLDMTQQSSLPTVEASSGFNAERASLFLESNITDGNNQFPEEFLGLFNQRDVNDMESMGNHAICEADVVPDLGSTNFPVVQMIPTDDMSSEQGIQLDIHERACLTKSFPIDIAGASPSEADLRVGLEYYPQSQFWNGSGEGVTSQFPAGCGDVLLGRYVVNGSTVFSSSSLPNKFQLPVFLHGSASPANSRVAQACEVVPGHFSPLPVNTLESPFESVSDWKFSQTHYASEAEINQLNEKWTDSQKLVSTKEPAKGFKKLLTFARKSRAHDVANADWVLASEGEEELENQRLSTDDASARGRLDEKIVFDRSGEKTNRNQISASKFTIC